MSGARRWFVALLAALIAVAALPALAADPCDAPVDLAGIPGPMRNVARAIATRHALRVLVVGTASSTLGGTSGPQATYPPQFAADLKTRLPNVQITLQTRGGRGLAASDLGGLLDAALPEFRPDLVIWQTGTVDAANGVDPDEFAATLRAGSERTAAAGANLILMDQQFSRLARATLNFAPYRQAMEAVANASDTVLLRRYDLMRHWVESGQIDPERAPRRDWQRITDQLHACIGRALAQIVMQGLRDARR